MVKERDKGIWKTLQNNLGKILMHKTLPNKRKRSYSTCTFMEVNAFLYSHVLYCPYKLIMYTDGPDTSGLTRNHKQLKT